MTERDQPSGHDQSKTRGDEDIYKDHREDMNVVLIGKKNGDYKREKETRKEQNPFAQRPCFSNHVPRILLV
jgi:hypothetical protein